VSLLAGVSAPVPVQLTSRTQRSAKLRGERIFKNLVRGVKLCRAITVINAGAHTILQRVSGRVNHIAMTNPTLQRPDGSAPRFVQVGEAEQPRCLVLLLHGSG